MPMEIMDEYRCFWEDCPIPKMPKSFLMHGKRRDAVEMLHVPQDEHSENDSRDSLSPVSQNHYDYRSRSPEYEHRPSSTSKSSQFSPSPESAFNKINRSHPEHNLSKPQLSPPTSTSGLASAYSGLYPPLFPYPPGSMSGENGALAFPYLPYPAMSVSSTSTDEKKESNSPDKNMFYYVDPRIPFTNYFLNLTRLLNNNTSKSYPATTPLGKMTAGDETRADEREPPMTPESPQSTTVTSPGLSRKRTHSEEDSIPETAKRVCDVTESPTRELPGKLNIHTFPDPATMANPFSAASLLSVSHPIPLMPMPVGGALFHPAMMGMHGGGAGYRRFNPEKPPPVKKYKCDVCGKAFSRSNTLVTHKRIHTGDKPFKCEICMRAFRQPGNLTRHRLTHTTVKPYVCPTCNKAFNRASNLHTHMRTHTSFKAFICPYCGKGFHQKIDMKIHCYTHTAHAAGRAEPPRM